MNRRGTRSEEHTSELQSHSDLHSFPTRRSSDLPTPGKLRVGVRAAGCVTFFARISVLVYNVNESPRNVTTAPELVRLLRRRVFPTLFPKGTLLDTAV